MKECDHLDFRSEARIVRILKDNEEFSPEAIPIVYTVDLRVFCKECDAPLLFQGLPQGVNMNGAAMSLDRTEARLTAQIEKPKELGHDRT